MNIQYFLPAIQREFVWKPEQIIKLFDSILRGYPIGSFLFWELESENRTNWDIYKFVDEGHQSGAHNQIASGAGVQQLTLILDGQQRLTTMLIGLKGSYVSKRKYRRYDDPAAWTRQHLYLDLFKDPRPTDEDEPDIYYGLEFLDEIKNESDRYWFKIGDVLDFANEDQFYEFRQTLRANMPSETPIGKLNLAERNLERLYRSVWKDAIVSYYVEHDQDYDRVLDIFARTNQAGTVLSKSDLLLSTITLRWKDVNGREDITAFVDRLNSDLTRKNDLDKDFVLKAALVLTDLPVQYRISNFTRTNLAKMENEWARIKRAIENCVNLVNGFGVDRDNLSSANSLIPLAYFLYQRNIDLRGSTPYETRNRGKMRQWLIGSLLNNVFGGSSDTVLREMRAVLRSREGNETDFPGDEIRAAVGGGRRTNRFDDDGISEFLGITYKNRESFLALSVLYEEQQWGTRPYHRDHIFPKSMFTDAKLEAAGISEEKRRDYMDWADYIGNLELLVDRENQEKSNLPFDQWITSRDDEFKGRHLIPSDANLYTLDRFEDFLESRENLIRERLGEVFQPVDRVG